MKTKKYTKFSDPGHGWLRVPVSDVRELEIADNISTYSYQKNNYIYLEEDSDAPLFLTEAEKRWKVEICHKNTGTSSSIKNFSSYNSHLTKNPIKLDDVVYIGSRYPKYNSRITKAQVLLIEKGHIVFRDIERSYNFKVLNKDLGDLVLSEKQAQRIIYLNKRMREIFSEIKHLNPDFPESSKDEMRWVNESGIFTLRDNDIVMKIREDFSGTIFSTRPEVPDFILTPRLISNLKSFRDLLSRDLSESELLREVEKIS